MSHRAIGVGLIAVGLSMAAIGAVLFFADEGGSGTPTAAPVTTVPVATTTMSAPPTTATLPSTTQAPTTTLPATTTTMPATTTTMPATTQAPTTTAPPAETPVEFFVAFVAAQSLGDTDFLVDRLHPAVFERYDRTDCIAYLDGVVVTEPNAEVLSVGGPAPWSWLTDGVTSDIADALTVRVRRTEDAGVTYVENDVHLVVADDGLIRWFTDCGTPKAGAQ